MADYAGDNDSINWFLKGFRKERVFFLVPKLHNGERIPEAESKKALSLVAIHFASEAMGI